MYGIIELCLCSIAYYQMTIMKVNVAEAKTTQFFVAPPYFSTTRGYLDRVQSSRTLFDVICGRPLWEMTRHTAFSYRSNVNSLFFDTPLKNHHDRSNPTILRQFL